MQFFKRSSQQISWSLLGHMTYISLNYRPVCRLIWKKVVPWQIVWFYTRRWLTSARWSNNNNSLKVQAIVFSKSTENSTKVSNWLSIAWWVSTSDSTRCNGTPELEEGRIIKLGAQVVKWLSKHLIFEHVHENLLNLLLRCKKGPYWCQKMRFCCFMDKNGHGVGRGGHRRINPGLAGMLKNTCVAVQCLISSKIDH